MKRAHKRWLLVVLLVVMLLLSCCLSVPMVIDYVFVSSRRSPVYTFAVDKPTPFLSDDLALRYANEALKRQGFDPKEWEPDGESVTTAPNGSHDIHLRRNGLNLNAGAISFRRRSGDDAGRDVQIELKEGKVYCEVWRMK